MRKILCKILTLGNHLWCYQPFNYKVLGKDLVKGCSVWCRIYKKRPSNQWEIYQKHFRGRKEGTYVTHNSNNS